jgi:hypothetical protein
MKSLLPVAVILQLVCAFPHGPEKSASPPQPKSPRPSTNSSRPVPGPASPAPAGCRVLSSDSNWPVDSEWKTALPGAVKRGPQNSETTRPDYHFSARSPADVQRAVNFANKNNIRLSIITTGHDFLSR